ncbi:MAG TPA: squalene synthase HpnC [Terriglobales bacterium]|nr:squalene synthase HpnC [Terriglobales bacterium]
MTQGGNTPLTASDWSALPSSYVTPATAPSLKEAREYCRRLATSHYENFSVATWFLPSQLREHFYAVYAYCRISDDLGDEAGDPQKSLRLLNAWEQELDACYEGRAKHPVFVALADTVRVCDIPKKPFADLLIAFRQDQTTTRYERFEDLLGYCRNSANPVGRLVLYVCGYSDEALQKLSDYTCVGLQLANFWQDVTVDWEKGRLYIPLEDMERFGVTEQQIAERRFSPEFRELMKYEVGRARDLFNMGLPLANLVDEKLGTDIELFTRGGQEILNAIERQDFNVLKSRPSISKSRKVALVLGAALRRVF